MQKIKTPSQRGEGKVFAWLALTLGMANGIIAPIFPGYVKDILKTDELTSVFFFSTAIFMLIACVTSTLIFRKINRTLMTKVSIIGLGLGFFSLVFVSNIVDLTLITALLIFCNMFLIIAIAMFVRDFAKSKGLGRQEGVHYKFQNIGIFIGPFIGGFIATQLSQELAFITAAAIVFSTLAYFLHKETIDRNPIILNAKKVSPEIIFKNIKIFFSNPQRVQSYLITLGFMLWVRFIRIYVPLFVLLEGYLDSMSGLIFALSIIPGILLEVKIGAFGDTHGAQKPVAYGFLFLALSSLLIYLSGNPLLSFAIIIASGIGAAMIEPMQETILFQALDKNEESQLYGVYMTAASIAFFLAPAIAALTLLFAPLKTLFLIFGLLMLGFAIFSWFTLKHLSPGKPLPE